MKNFFTKFKSFTKWFFSPSNIIKISIIFTIGIISRYFINEHFSTNVFVDYLTVVSILFYLGFSSFIVIINELFSYYDMNNYFYSLINLSSKFLSELMFYLSSFCSFIKQLMFGKNIHYFDNVRYTRMEDTRYTRTSSNYNVTTSRVYSNPTSQVYTNSVYNRIREENAYIDPSVLTNVERIPNPSHYPSSSVERIPNPSHYPPSSIPHPSDYYSPTSPNQNRFYNQDDNNPRYFVIDTFEDNGQVTRYSYSPNGDYNVNYNVYPATPRPSNLTTPETMSPLFNSNENLGQRRNPSSSSVFTNDTNHATIGENRSEDYINWEARRHQVGRALDNLASGLIKEIEVPFESHRGKVSLGAKYHSNSSIHSLYVKYHDIAKRKFFWKIWEKGRNSYNSYEEFKINFDPKTNIWKEIAKTTKKDISREIRDLLNSDPFGTKRPSISGRNLGRVTTSRTQENLNNLNSNRYNSHYIRRSER